MTRLDLDATELSTLRTENETLRAERNAAIARAEEAERGSAWRPMKDAPTGVPIVAKHKPNDAMPHGWIATILLGHDDEEEAGALDTILHYNGNAIYRSFHGCWDGWMTCEEASALPTLTAKLAQAEGEIATMRAALESIKQVSAVWVDPGRLHTDDIVIDGGSRHHKVLVLQEPGRIAHRALTNPEHPHGD